MLSEFSVSSGLLWVRFILSSTYYLEDNAWQGRQNRLWHKNIVHKNNLDNHVSVLEYETILAVRPSPSVQTATHRPTLAITTCCRIPQLDEISSPIDSATT